MTGDGVGDLVVAAGFGGGPRISVWDGTSLQDGAYTLRPIGDFFGFEETLRSGAYVAAGGVSGDGRADIVLGGGPGGRPRVRVADPVPLAPAVAAGAGDPDDRGGVRLSVGDFDGDGLADVAAGGGATGRVAAYAGRSIRAGDSPPASLLDFDALPGLAGGVYVG